MEGEALVTAAASLYGTSNHHLVPSRNTGDVPITNQSLSNEDIKVHINNRAQENPVFAITKHIHQIDSVGDCLRLNEHQIDSVGDCSGLNEDIFSEEIAPSVLINDKILGYGIDVEVYDSKLRKYEMVLRGFGKDPTIVNLYCWNELRQDNDFAAGMKVQISIYRDAVTRKLCFAIYKISE